MMVVQCKMRKFVNVKSDESKARPKLKLDMPLDDFKRKKDKNCAATPPSATNERQGVKRRAQGETEARRTYLEEVGDHETQNKHHTDRDGDRRRCREQRARSTVQHLQRVRYTWRHRRLQRPQRRKRHRNTRSRQTHDQRGGRESRTQQSPSKGGLQTKHRTPEPETKTTRAL